MEDKWIPRPPSIKAAKKPLSWQRMVTTIAELAKYIDICHDFVEERVVSNEIRVIYCCTDDMIADI